MGRTPVRLYRTGATVSKPCAAVTAQDGRRFAFFRLVDHQQLDRLGAEIGALMPFADHLDDGVARRKVETLRSRCRSPAAFGEHVAVVRTDACGRAGWRGPMSKIDATSCTSFCGSTIGCPPTFRWSTAAGHHHLAGLGAPSSATAPVADSNSKTVARMFRIVPPDRTAPLRGRREASIARSTGARGHRADASCGGCRLTLRPLSGKVPSDAIAWRDDEGLSQADAGEEAGDVGGHRSRQWRQFDGRGGEKEEEALSAIR